MKEQRYLTVGALTLYIKRKFDHDPHLQEIFVKGEISNFKRHSSGHMYFTLKDEKSRILAVMFSRSARSVKFEPENGMKVLISGEISVYEPSGQYQIYVKQMQPDGVGDLFLAFEQLKERLQKEGLFASERKRPIPKFPKTVGVITSPTGAAVRDIITTIKRRFPIANILIYPALVQGAQAAPSVAGAIELANRQAEADVLIVGRGGGSIEELWAFNEEQVARAIVGSDIPVISAVGHETDFTIADFAADHRAPTPTGAAEMAVPHIDELAERILNRQSRLIRAMRERAVLQRERLGRLQKSYAFRYPQRLYEQKLEQADKMTEQLKKSAGRLAELKREERDRLLQRLLRNHPNDLYKEAKETHLRGSRALGRAMKEVLTKKQKEFSGMVSTLEALSPLKIMDRGYSLAYSGEGELLKSVSQVEKGDDVQVKLADGTFNCKVTGKEE
ncbi:MULTISPECIES: exodeoxyribonuclease VII large subunit [Bacillaceae]|uniref:Exodeoxyribonuclease 7 large subunit n=2 Tax=Bacillus TaxID=1386 RepID=A0A5D4SUN2_9BACI|nr:MULTISPECIES: exodeoxyribonuclease VII large subunit [Bacillus]MCA1036164.1 exodeoxyribonuclease VII large subunit [Bacillus infantis]MCP1159719.1 exodeoxyribonuclease VII large subunit [Bacillus infantis]MDT0159994.1 exodeoxyribonuclease VII large subunit [Bacillus sp. AG4(2022)]MDW2875548.1 exodeoxyribonuclease VII large subunit [Bacillus infantis]RYI31391.1 exodeoxyribonuclease VII large subunit [Bacillus infantis]